MAKIESKEALYFRELIRVLRLFWRNHEDVVHWNDDLEKEYNNAFNSFKFFLEGLNIKGFEIYITIARHCFKTVKDDFKLYEKLKKNTPQFFKSIYHQLGYDVDSFKSPVLKLLDEESDKSTSRKEESKKRSSHGTKPKKARKEDAIDRMMKNEYIRKNSVIDYDQEEALEDIIGSQKTEDTKKSAEKSIKKKKTKVTTKVTTKITKKGATKVTTKKTTKVTKRIIRTEQEFDDATPRVSHDYHEREKAPERMRDQNFSQMDKSMSEIKELIEEPTPHPRHDMPMKFEKDPESSLNKISMNLKTFNSKLVRSNCEEKHLLLPYSAEMNQESDYKLDLKDIPSSSKHPIHYTAMNINGDQIQNQVHIVPEYLKLGDSTKRVYSCNKSNLATIRRKILRRKNFISNMFLHPGLLYEDMLNHTFSPEGVLRYIRENQQRSYKTNPVLYFNSTDYWFGRFEILRSFFESLLVYFQHSLVSARISTPKAMYSVPIAVNVFSQISLTTVPLIGYYMKNGAEFIDLVHQFICQRAKPKQKRTPKFKMLDYLHDFVDAGRLQFWDTLYSYRPVEKPKHDETASQDGTSEYVEEHKTPSFSASKKKSIRKKKKKVANEKKDADFMAQFQKEENELEKSLKTPPAKKIKKRAFVTTTPRNKDDVKGISERSSQKSSTKKPLQSKKQVVVTKEVKLTETRRKSLIPGIDKSKIKAQHEEDKAKTKLNDIAKEEQQRQQKLALEKLKRNAERKAQREAKEKQAKQEAIQARKIAAQKAREEQRLQRIVFEKMKINLQKKKEREEQEKQQKEQKEQTLLAQKAAEEKARKAQEEKDRLQAEAEAKLQQQEQQRKADEERKLQQAVVEKMKRNLQKKKEREEKEQQRKQEAIAARKIATEKARKEQEEKKRLQLLALERMKRNEEKKAQREAAEKQKKQEAIQARKIAAENARIEAEEKKKLKAIAIEQMRKNAEAKAKKDAEEKKKKDAAEALKKEAAEKARKESEERKKAEDEKKKAEEAKIKKQKAKEKKAHRAATSKLSSIKDSCKPFYQDLSQKVNQVSTIEASSDLLDSQNAYHESTMTQINELELTLGEEAVSSVKKILLMQNEKCRKQILIKIDTIKMDQIEQTQNANYKNVMKELQKKKKKQDLALLDALFREQMEKHNSLMNEIDSYDSPFNQKRLQKLEEEQKRLHQNVIGEIEERRKAIDKKKLDEIEKLHKEHVKNINKEIKDKANTENLLKLDLLEDQQKGKYEVVMEQITNHRSNYDQARLDRIQNDQREHQNKVVIQIEEIRKDLEKKQLDKIEQNQKRLAKNVLQKIEEIKESEDLAKLDEIERIQHQYADEVHKQIEKSRKNRNQTRLNQIELYSREHHNKLIKQIDKIRSEKEAEKLDSLEASQKKHMDHVLKEIEQHRHTEDLQKLEEIEKIQLKYAKEVHKQIEENRKNRDQIRLNQIEFDHKEHHQNLILQIEKIRTEKETRRLDRIEDEQKAHMQEVDNLIEQQKEAKNLQKLNEIEQIQHKYTENFIIQVQESMGNRDQERLKKIKETHNEYQAKLNDQVQHLRTEIINSQLQNEKTQEESKKTSGSSSKKRKTRAERKVKSNRSSQKNMLTKKATDKKTTEKKTTGRKSKNSRLTTRNTFDDISITVSTPQRPAKALRTKTALSVEKEFIQKRRTTVKKPKTKKIIRKTVEEEKQSPFASVGTRRRRNDRLTSKENKLLEECKYTRTIRVSLPEKLRQSHSLTKRTVTKIKPQVKKKAPKAAKSTTRSSTMTSKSKTSRMSTLAKERSPNRYMEMSRSSHTSVMTSSYNLKDIHYLGMKPQEEDHKRILDQQIIYALKRIIADYPYDSLDFLRAALEAEAMEENKWTRASDPYHITSSLINGKATTRTKKAIEEFKIGIEEKVDVNCIIIVENLFIASLMKPKLIEINANIPYMALWMNGSKPKDITKILDYLIYQVKPSLKHAEERLRAYYAIIGKSLLKDDVIGEISMNFDKYGKRKVWFCFIKDNIRLALESFIKKTNKD